jgi:hypothetical protein
MNTCACGKPADGDGTTCQQCSALHELGLRTGATDAEVKAAHRLYVKAWHPDHFPGDEQSKNAAQEKLKTINSAYDFLTSPSSRKGPAYRPEPTTPAQREASTQQKQSSAKQPTPLAARRRGWFVFFASGILFAVFVVWMFVPTSSKLTSPSAGFAPRSSSSVPYQPEHNSSPDPSNPKPGNSAESMPAQTVDSAPSVETPDIPLEPSPAPPRDFKPPNPNADTSGIERRAWALYRQNLYLEAATLFDQACTSGSGEACSNLGAMYARGEGVAKDGSHAVEFTSKGCDAGNSPACRFAGISYAKGDGVTQDYRRAAAFLSRACNGGDAGGCTSLGLLYSNGLGVGKDLEKAKQLLTKGCNLGAQWACDRLNELR